MDYARDVRSFVVANFLFGDEDGLYDSASFIETGIIDSTGILELVAYLEESFGIIVADDEFIPENLGSIADIADYLERKRHLDDIRK
jgi:acyl carrier protein